MSILYIASRFPYPLNRGDKVRNFHQIKYLAKNHAVHLLVFSCEKVDEDSLKVMSKHCSSIGVISVGLGRRGMNLVKTGLGSLPLQVGYFLSPGVQSFINESLQRFAPEIVFCSQVRTAPAGLSCPAGKRVLDYVDAFSSRATRRAGYSSIFGRGFWRLEATRMRDFETHCNQLFDQKVIISESERSALPQPAQEGTVVIPNGVDSDYFQPGRREKDFDLLFVGSLDYAANIDAIQYLVREVLPRVRNSRPSTRLLIAGAGLSRSVAALRSPTVVIESPVQDIRNSYERAHLMVAPMRLGGGVQNKLLEAMAMGLPCITSELGAAAFAEAGAFLRVARSTEEYSEQILQLLGSESDRSSFGESARDYVKKRFRWEVVGQSLEYLLSEKCGSQIEGKALI